MSYDPKAKDVYDFGYEYDGLPKALTPAQRAKCIHYLNHSFRYNNSYERLGSILNTYLDLTPEVGHIKSVVPSGC
jgi:hypothetical protein